MIHDHGQFDYIVVGAGSAGCVVAARLSENRSVRVLLLEAGGRDLNPWIHVPLGYGKLFRHPRLNWRYRNDPEPGLDNRQVDQPRGKVLGGSSSINGLIYIRGQREDFDSWRLGGPVAWDYDHLLPYFRKAEDQCRGADQWHGAGGPLAVSDPGEAHPLCDAFIQAAAQAGHPVNPDFNGAGQEGAGYYQLTTRLGLRCSAAVAYLNPAKGRPNLTIAPQALARRVVFEGRRAVAVEWSAQGGLHTARAGAEVVLAAGAINTPQLLQLSGVGPGALLQALGIPIVHDSPGVGENFQDHLQTRLVYRATRPITLNDDMASWWRMLGMGLRYVGARKGPLTIGAGYAGGFFRSSQIVVRPDIQVHFITFSTTKMGDRLHDFSGFTASSCQLRPTSRGHVRVVSPDIGQPPSILANYLATEEDRRTSVTGLKMLRAIGAQSAMAGHIVGEEMPGPAIVSDADLLAYIRQTGGSIYHPSCSAAMGDGVEAPLSSDLTVNGVDGLRVIDASVMPSLISGNTNAAIIAIAERGADLIKAAARSI